MAATFSDTYTVAAPTSGAITRGFGTTPGNVWQAFSDAVRVRITPSDTSIEPYTITLNPTATVSITGGTLSLSFNGAADTYGRNNGNVIFTPSGSSYTNVVGEWLIFRDTPLGNLYVLSPGAGNLPISDMNVYNQRLHDRAEERLAVGIQGEQGEQGEQGVAGAAGRDGVDGQDGQDGRDGQDGQDGQDGADAVITFASTEQAEAGVDTGVSMDPSLTAAAIRALAPSGAHVQNVNVANFPLTHTISGDAIHISQPIRERRAENGTGIEVVVSGKVKFQAGQTGTTNASFWMTLFQGTTGSTAIQPTIGTTATAVSHTLQEFHDTFEIPEHVNAFRPRYHYSGEGIVAVEDLVITIKEKTGIADGSIGEEKLADESVTNRIIAPNSVSFAQFRQWGGEVVGAAGLSYVRGIAGVLSGAALVKDDVSGQIALYHGGATAATVPTRGIEGEVDLPQDVIAGIYHSTDRNGNNLALSVGASLLASCSARPTGSATDRTILCIADRALTTGSGVRRALSLAINANGRLQIWLPDGAGGGTWTTESSQTWAINTGRLLHVYMSVYRAADVGGAARYNVRCGAWQGSNSVGIVLNGVTANALPYMAARPEVQYGAEFRHNSHSVALNGKLWDCITVLPESERTAFANYTGEEYYVGDLRARKQKDNSSIGRKIWLLNGMNTLTDWIDGSVNWGSGFGSSAVDTKYFIFGKQVHVTGENVEVIISSDRPVDAYLGFYHLTSHHPLSFFTVAKPVKVQFSQEVNFLNAGGYHNGAFIAIYEVIAGTANLDRRILVTSDRSERTEEIVDNDATYEESAIFPPIELLPEKWYYSVFRTELADLTWSIRSHLSMEFFD